MPSKQIPATKLTDVSATAQEGLGEIRYGEGDGKEYRYVKLTVGAAIKGDVAGFVSSNNFAVTASTHSADPEDRPAGVFLGTVANAEHCWIQRKGYSTYVRTDGAIVANSILYKASAIKGQARVSVDGNHMVGVAVAADVDSVASSVFLDCL